MFKLMTVLVAVFFLSACQTTKVSEEPQVNLNYTKAGPTYQPKETVGVIWGCSDPKAVIVIASANSEVEYFKLLEMYTRRGACTLAPEPFPVVLNTFHFSFIGTFGPGEAWTIDTINNSEVFVLVHPRNTRNLT